MTVGRGVGSRCNRSGIRSFALGPSVFADRSAACVAAAALVVVAVDGAGACQCRRATEAYPLPPALGASRLVLFVLGGLVVVGAGWGVFDWLAWMACTILAECRASVRW